MKCRNSLSNVLRLVLRGSTVRIAARAIRPSFHLRLDRGWRGSHKTQAGRCLELHQVIPARFTSPVTAALESRARFGGKFAFSEMQSKVLLLYHIISLLMLICHDGVQSSPVTEDKRCRTIKAVSIHRWRCITFR